MAGKSSKKLVNQNAKILKERFGELYKKTKDDPRSDFYRDYTRILHSNAYRRLKHKTQVFFNIGNDHVCTRIEHVQHVESVSYSLAKGLGLDTELTRAIACGHDLGHAPFGHWGETVINKRIIKELSTDYKKKNYPGVNFNDNNNKVKIFWHERNGLRFVDNIELLPDAYGNLQNLHLTYAVRDGIISHCGEVDQNEIKPRNNAIDLDTFKMSGQYSPYTWEGCIVKVSDKIAYLGRDIEDAYALGFLNDADIAELKDIAREFGADENINTTSLMHLIIRDIIENTSAEAGIKLSENTLKLFNRIKKYNYDHIYFSHRFDVYHKYVELIINSIYDTLLSVYKDKKTKGNPLTQLNNNYGKIYKTLISDFTDYLAKYCDLKLVKDYNPDVESKYVKFKNNKIYGDLSNRDDYVWAVTDFISGMTDKYAIAIFDELITLS